MSRLGVRVEVEAGGVAVVGRPLVVHAVVTADADVELTAVALGYVGHWWGRALVPVPSVVARSRGKDVWGLATPVDHHAPVRLRAGEQRRWSAPLGPATYPTLPSRGMRLLELRHEVEAAVATAGSIRPAQANRAVAVMAPRGLHPELAGRVTAGDPGAPVRVVSGDAPPGGSFALSTTPGAVVELVREERRARPLGPFGRRRRVCARAVAGPDGTVTLAVPPDAVPSVHHHVGELRWSAEVQVGRAGSVVELDVYQVA